MISVFEKKQNHKDTKCENVDIIDLTQHDFITTQQTADI